jgi:hypothetical protein
MHRKPTTFQLAFDAYVNSLPPKKRIRNFLAQCNSLASDLSPDAVSKIVEDAEEKCSQKTSRRIIRKIVQPIVEVLKAYDQVICTLGTKTFAHDIQEAHVPSSSSGSNAQCFDMGRLESHRRRKNLPILRPSINTLIPVIQGSHRFVGLFETIRSHLESMRFHLQSINFYEDLYGSSTEMQNLFFNSYIHILKFWSRVDKECQRCCKSPALLIHYSC